MNPNLSNRDAMALALAAGVKVGGGSWSQAFAWGIGSRLLMNYLGFPDEAVMPPQAQGVVSFAGSLCQRIFGNVPPDVAQQYAAPVQDTYSPVIDAEFTSHG